MVDKQNEIADFLLSQIEDGCASKDDMLDAIFDKYNNDKIGKWLNKRISYIIKKFTLI